MLILSVHRQSHKKLEVLEFNLNSMDEVIIGAGYFFENQVKMTARQFLLEFGTACSVALYTVNENWSNDKNSQGRRCTVSYLATVLGFNATGVPEIDDPILDNVDEFLSKWIPEVSHKARETNIISLCSQEMPKAKEYINFA